MSLIVTRFFLNGSRAFQQDCAELALVQQDASIRINAGYGAPDQDPPVLRWLGALATITTKLFQEGRLSMILLLRLLLLCQGGHQPSLFVAGTDQKGLFRLSASSSRVQDLMQFLKDGRLIKVNGLARAILKGKDSRGWYDVEACAPGCMPFFTLPRLLGTSTCSAVA